MIRIPSCLLRLCYPPFPLHWWNCLYLLFSESAWFLCHVQLLISVILSRNWKHVDNERWIWHADPFFYFSNPPTFCSVLPLSSAPETLIHFSGIFQSHQWLVKKKRKKGGELEKIIRKILNLWCAIHHSLHFYPHLLPPSTTVHPRGGLAVREYDGMLQTCTERGLEPSSLNTSHHHRTLLSFQPLHYLTAASVLNLQRKTHTRTHAHREWVWVGLTSIRLKWAIRNENTKSF